MPTRITVADLEATAKVYPAEVQNDRARFLYVHGGTTIRHFFGLDWTSRTFLADAPSGQTHLTLDLSSVEAGQRSIFRFLEFAETLFNLQEVEGFDDRIEYMKTADLESSCAELNIAKFLYIHDIPFKFVIPQKQKRGEDYDIELTYPDGRVACAEVKCRVEAAEIRPELLKNPFGLAVKQLPRDRPGIIFSTLPQTWFGPTDLSEEIRRTADNFLRGTQRVVLIVFLASLYKFKDGIIWNPHRHAQVPNLNHRFDRNVPWQLAVRPITVGLPSKWHRIFTERLGEKQRT